MAKPVVSIVMGSDSDLELMKETAQVLGQFRISHELRVLSAHRSPRLLARYVASAEKAGVRVFIAGAGAAAALPGAVAALTTRPVLGVPIPSSDLKGLDSLLAIAQMPAGIPAATLAIGKAGARNAGHLAAEILALSDPRLASELVKYRAGQEKGIAKKDAQVRKKGSGAFPKKGQEPL
jgi:5-(carboxyamino)imidazole ribonucleotide mutase